MKDIDYVYDPREMPINDSHDSPTNGPFDGPPDDLDNEIYDIPSTKSGESGDIPGNDPDIDPAFDPFDGPEKVPNLLKVNNKISGSKSKE